eukprot:403365_1
MSVALRMDIVKKRQRLSGELDDEVYSGNDPSGSYSQGLSRINNGQRYDYSNRNYYDESPLSDASDGKEEKIQDGYRKYGVWVNDLLEGEVEIESVEKTLPCTRLYKGEMSKGKEYGYG